MKEPLSKGPGQRIFSNPRTGKGRIKRKERGSCTHLQRSHSMLKDDSYRTENWDRFTVMLNGTGTSEEG